MKQKIPVLAIMLFALLSCKDNVVHIKNLQKGKLKATHCLVESDSKIFKLDYETAPRPTYIQIIENMDDKRVLSLLNTYNNAIYFFEYDTADSLGRVCFNKEGANSILRMAAFYVINYDSIYVLNSLLMKISLTDTAGNVKKNLPLIPSFDIKSNDFTWCLTYPQYDVHTANPILKHNDKLYFTGLAPFSVQDSLIDKFHFMACLDYKSDTISYFHTYPRNLYGHNYVWAQPVYTRVFSEIMPSENIAVSFPVSHDLHIAEFDKEGYTTVYSGSNNAATISSLKSDFFNVPEDLIYENYFSNYLYETIKYDKWRKVYYRFFTRRLPEGNIKTPLKNKEHGVIIMDKDFNYLGETIIGNEKHWNFDNVFVTREGLNIEYLDFSQDTEEEYLRFKIFIPKQL